MLVPPPSRPPKADEDIPEDQTLPALFEDHEIALPQQLSTEDSLETVKKADVQITNDMLGICYGALKHVNTVSGALRVVDTTLRVVVERRKLLNLQYGSDSKGEKGFLDPIP